MRRNKRLPARMHHVPGTARLEPVAALLIAFATAGPGVSSAQLRVAPLIGDGMVMQRHAAVPVWGWADPGDTVVVTVDSYSDTAVADPGGRWRVRLLPRAAGGPYEMTVATRQARLQVRDILIGDVWVCAGQSNMEWEVRQARNAPEEIAGARDIRIRHLRVRSSSSSSPGDTLGGAWAPADSAHVGQFTAVGYYFARELRKAVDVPIGLLNTAVGGSQIESWLSPDELHLAASGTPPESRGGELYKRMVQPLLSYPIRGVLWYQGEFNAFPGGDVRYREQLAGLIQAWRRAWGRGDLPFLIVQLPSFGPPDTVPALSTSWALLRESQSTALRLPKTALAVTIDLGEAHDLHPTNKQDVGARLALAARKVAYGEPVVHSGPVYRRHRIGGGRVELEFDHVGQGLVLGRPGEELQGFAITGHDQQFVWAKAAIEGDRVVVWSDQVPHPVAVRYAWGNNPDRANLFNRDGLPAVPFRTDGWPELRVQDYLGRASDRELLTKDNIPLVGALTQRSSDRGFALFRRHALQINQIMGEAGYVERLIDGVIAKEEVMPHLRPNDSLPKWEGIAKTITRKYGTAAANRITAARQQRLKELQQVYADHDSLDPGDLNNRAWAVFLGSNDYEELRMAIAWMEGVVRQLEENEEPGLLHFAMDTYANLLYKVGRVDEAITLQEKAVAIAAGKNDGTGTVYRANLEKMKKGEPTWPQL